MAKFLDRLARRFGYAKRSFTGAQMSRLTASLPSHPTHLNYDLSRDLKALRARSRDLAINNDYARKFLRMVSTNIVGPSGFQLQVRAMQPDGRLDERDSNALENAFYKWGRPGSCDVTGRLSFCDVQRLLIQTVARDGEVLVMRVPRGPFGYQLQLLDPELLDPTFNDTRRETQIRMSVEVDRLGAPIAYWLLSTDPTDPRGYVDSVGVRRVRVPASEIWHLFIPEQIGQVRGVPWMASAMLRLNMLGGYEEAAVTAARVGAAQMGVIESPDGEVDGLGNDTDAGGNQIMDAEPGSFQTLPPGYKLSGWNPDYPHAQYGTFVKACLRGISSGLGVAYNTLANDLEGVNYSSIRAGVLEERDVWKALQNWMAESFLHPLYSEWLGHALLTKELPLPMHKFDKFDAATWIGRRWEWVDPEKDINAQVTAIKHGLKSRRQVMAEQGNDLEETWSDLKAEQDKASVDGVKLDDLQQEPQPQ